MELEVVSIVEATVVSNVTDGEGVAITGCSDDIANEALVEKDSVVCVTAEVTVPTSEKLEVAMVGDGVGNTEEV